MATPEEQRSQTGEAVAAVAATSAVGFPRPPVEPVASGGKLTAAGVLAIIRRAFRGFLDGRRDDLFDMLVGFLKNRYPDQPQSVRDDILEEERRREVEFRRKAEARLVRGVRRALQEPDFDRRMQRVEAVLNQERNYTLAREEAVITRAVNAQEQRLLEVLSPEGAFWALSPFVQTHTPDCIAMAGKFWPWPVLRKIAPPLHHGCGCQLYGLTEAQDLGLLPASFVPPKDDDSAFRLAHMLLRPYPDVRMLLESAVVEEGLFGHKTSPRDFRDKLEMLGHDRPLIDFDPHKHPRDRLGRFIETLNALAVPSKKTPGDTVDVRDTPHLVRPKKGGRFEVENTDTGEKRELSSAESAAQYVISELHRQEAREELERSRREREESRAEREARQEAERQQEERERERGAEAARRAFEQKYPTNEDGLPYYYRLESPSQDDTAARQQVDTGQVWGRAPRNTFAGSTPKVQAYRGRLPEGAQGIEFVTLAPADEGGPPGQVSWSHEHRNLRFEGPFAKLDVVVTNNTQLLA